MIISVTDNNEHYAMVQSNNRYELEYEILAMIEKLDEINELHSLIRILKDYREYIKR